MYFSLVNSNKRGFKSVAIFLLLLVFAFFGWESEGRRVNEHPSKRRARSNKQTLVMSERKKNNKNNQYNNIVERAKLLRSKTNVRLMKAEEERVCTKRRESKTGVEIWGVGDVRRQSPQIRWKISTDILDAVVFFWRDAIIMSTNSTTLLKISDTDDTAIIFVSFGGWKQKYKGKGNVTLSWLSFRHISCSLNCFVTSLSHCHFLLLFHRRSLPATLYSLLSINISLLLVLWKRGMLRLNTVAFAMCL